MASAVGTAANLLPCGSPRTSRRVGEATGSARALCFLSVWKPPIATSLIDRSGVALSLSELGSIIVLAALTASAIATSFGVMPWGYA